MPHWAAHQLFASFPRTDRSTTFASFRFAGDATQLLSLPLTSNNNENNNNNSSSKTASSNRRRRKGKLTGGYGREQKKKQENSSPSLPRGTDVKVKWPSKVSGEKTNIDTFRTVFETKKKTAESKREDEKARTVGLTGSLLRRVPTCSNRTICTPVSIKHQVLYKRLYFIISKTTRHESVSPSATLQSRFVSTD